MNYHRDKDYLENESMFRNIFKKRFNVIKKYHLAGGTKTVLDIGCSNGVFLDLFAGSETWGVEPSGSGEVAKKKGHKILKTTFEKASLPENYFDLVIINHTLEHMDDPQAVLTKVFGLLKNNGILFVDVPNAGSLGARILGKRWPYLLPKEHKSQFTKESLNKLLKDNGFEILHWESRSGVFEYANPLKELGRKRFLIDILTSPYCLVASALKMGDSMSFIARKIE